MLSRQRGLGGASRVFASIRANTGDVLVRNLVGLLGWLGGRPPPARVATVSPLSSSAESLALSRLPIAEQTAACIVSGSCGCLLSLARIAEAPPTTAQLLRLLRLK